MVESKRGLGRGLSALLDEAAAATTPEARRAAGVRELPIETVVANPDQPRRHFDPAALEELAESIRLHGVIQPILVRATEGETYQIVAGERRWRAAQRAQLETIPALVRNLNDAEVMGLALVENLQRSDLNPIEEARAYRSLAETFGRNHETIAQLVGKSRPHVANTLRLTRLPEKVQALVIEGALSAGHARALLDLDNAEALADEAVKKGLSVRQVEAMAAKLKTGPRARQARLFDADAAAVEHDLAETLGLKVKLIDKGGKGELRIAYESLEQLDAVLAKLHR
jgi:ParB family transcriptional regulator, chromosome partitioning protein